MEAKLILEKLDKIKSQNANTIDRHVFDVWLYFVISDSGDLFNGIHDLSIKTKGKYKKESNIRRLKNDQKRP